MFHRMPGPRVGGRDSSNPSRLQEVSFDNQGSVLSNEDLFKQNDRPHSLQKLDDSHSGSREPVIDENLCNLRCSAVNLVGPMHRVSLMRGRRLNPYIRMSEQSPIRSSCQRLQCLDSQGTFCRSDAFSAGLTCSDRLPLKTNTPHDRLAYGTTWLSLDGLLVDVEAATTSKTIGNLEPQEAVTWESFAPLQRVLLVAITAAAAAGAKQRSLHEMSRLQHAIENRDKESILLHKDIRHLQQQLKFWRERARPLCGEVQSHYERAIENLGTNDSIFPQIRYGLEITPKCAPKLLEQYATPQWGKGLKRSSESIGFWPKHSAFRTAGDDNEGLMTVQTDENAELSGESFLHQAWNMHSANFPGDDEKTDSVDWLSDYSFLAEQITPCLPLSQLEKSITPRVLHDKNSALWAQNQVQELLVSEASQVMAACALIIEKAQNLEKFYNMDLSMTSNTSIEEFKQAVEQAAAQITSLQRAISNMGHALGPEALAALNVSHSELDGYITKTAKTNDQDVSTSFTALPWKHWLDQPVESQIETEDSICRRTDVEERRLSGMSDWSIDTSSDLGAELQQGVGKDVVSAIECAVKKTVDDLMAPLDKRCEFGGRGNSSEMIIEQLLHELENAAAKVASMEVQMKNLRDSRRFCERKRKEAEQKLAMAQRNLNNQASGHLDVADLMGRLELDEFSCERSMWSQQEVGTRRWKAPDIVTKDNTSNRNAKGEVTTKMWEAPDIVPEDITSDRNAKGNLALLHETSKAKEKTIARLQEEIAELQRKVSDLTIIQTPNGTKHKNVFSLPTFVASNLLFDLDSPVKIDSPQSAGSTLLWQGFNETSQVNSSLEEEKGGVKIENCTQSTNSSLLLEGPEEPSRVINSLAKERIGGKNENDRLELESDTCTSQTYGSNREAEHTCSSIQSGKAKSRPLVSSNKEQSGNLAMRSICFTQPKLSTSHARKLTFTSLDSRFSEDNRRFIYVDGTSRVTRREGKLRASVNVLAGVQPNTPIRARKFGGKERIQRNLRTSVNGVQRNLSNSVDSLNRAKENFSKRRRWM